MKKTKSLYDGHRFPAVVISCAVRWYFRFSLSLRDLEELLLERGVVVTYAPKEVPKGRNDPLLVRQVRRSIRPARQSGAAQAGQHMASGRDVYDAARRAVSVVASGRRAWCRTWTRWRKSGATRLRQGAAAKRFLRRVLRSNPVPRRIVTEQL